MSSTLLHTCRIHSILFELAAHVHKNDKYQSQLSIFFPSNERELLQAYLLPADEGHIQKPGTVTADLVNKT